MTVKASLTTFELARLDQACRSISEGCGHWPYLVGSVSARRDARDVDVRLILPDEEFDALFGGRQPFWGLFCYAVSAWLRADTGLPIDFQVQRQTEANEKHHGGSRNPLGLRLISDFAGGGDATRFQTTV